MVLPLLLLGVHLVFSRVIPLESNPRQHPLWQLAEQFGATCGEQCNETTTHVVATHGGTEKVRAAAPYMCTSIFFFVL
jgi:RNA polymerase II C-terminal domain phosphatase-like 3/4